MRAQEVAFLFSLLVCLQRVVAFFRHHDLTRLSVADDVSTLLTDAVSAHDVPSEVRVAAEHGGFSMR